MSRLQVTHVVASLDSRCGGPSRTIPALCEALMELDVDISILTQTGENESIGFKSVYGSMITSFPCGLRYPRWLGIPLVKALENSIIAGHVDLIHTHGVWDFTNYRVAKLAKRYGIPLCIHTRGMLEPWALQNRQLKKAIALKTYQKQAFDYASLIFVTSDQERKGLRLAGIKAPAAVVPNGVPNSKQSSNPPAFVNPRVKTMLFLSRIQKKKGLVNLLMAWNNIASREWQLVIVGPDEEGHAKEIVDLSKNIGCDNVLFFGEVSDFEKGGFYQYADLFVLPTFSENFGVVVVEALSYGLPVITTKGAPWESLLANSCGWWVEPNQSAIQSAMEEAMSLSDDMLHEMGARGIKLAESFDWRVIALETKTVYKWILGGDVPVSLSFE